MQIKKHAIKPCARHQSHRFVPGCTFCLTESLVSLCELLDQDPSKLDNDEEIVTHSLAEIFDGTQLAHFSQDNVVNVTALPINADDVRNNTVRYVVEYKKS